MSRNDNTPSRVSTHRKRAVPAASRLALRLALRLVPTVTR
jgi:hypothetical protein